MGSNYLRGVPENDKIIYLFIFGGLEHNVSNLVYTMFIIIKKKKVCGE